MYCDKEETIFQQIKLLSKYHRLWIDTEIANWEIPSKARLSLIQILPETEKSKSQKAKELVKDVIILDVIDKDITIETFIKEIMFNNNIEKIFHNKSFDIRWLGKEKAQNCYCTLEMSRKFPKFALQSENNKLKSLVEYFFPEYKVDKEEQTSDWGKRPLNEDQIKYAMLDPVYLAMIYYKLLDINVDQQYSIVFKKNLENISDIEKELLEVESIYEKLEDRYDFLKSKLIEKMKNEKKSETEKFVIKKTERKTQKINLKVLVEKLSKNNPIDFEITLTKELKDELDKHKIVINENDIKKEISSSEQLKKK